MKSNGGSARISGPGQWCAFREKVNRGDRREPCAFSPSRGGVCFAEEIHFQVGNQLGCITVTLFYSRCAPGVQRDRGTADRGVNEPRPQG